MSKTANALDAFRRTFAVSLLLLGAPMVVGCQGCRRDDLADADKSSVGALPVAARSIEAYPHAASSERTFVKPGHWTTVAQTWQSNDKDVRGTLEVSALASSKDPSRVSEEAPLASIRSASLPKGQSKVLETRVLIPTGAKGEQAEIRVQSQLNSPDLRVPTATPPTPVRALKSNEYFLVVLTTRPTQFSQMQNASWARVIRGSAPQQLPVNFRVVIPGDSSGTLALPDTFFEWTAIAYVLWDDLAPEALTPAQRRALSDWVHWGGQVIFNGPSSGEELSDSELSWLLPMDQVRSAALDSAELRELIEAWSLTSDTGAAAVQAGLVDGVERVGIQGVLKAPLASLVAPKSLVWEQRHGYGFSRMTGFDLTSGWLRNWNSYESFFNSVVLRRPPRVYEATNGDLVQNFSEPLRGKELDARLSTRLRIFSRDAFFPSAKPFAEEASIRTPDNPMSDRRTSLLPESVPEPAELATAPTPISPWLAGYRRELAGEDVASWNEKNDVAAQALNALREEAGIDVPSIRFVAQAIGIYLLILIPINYLLFWLLGRLEIAWFSIPFIGIVGAFWIAHEAQLDIGFARSRTEIAVVELQPGYERALVTRYTAIYNSLSTTYSLDFSDRDAVAAPVDALQSRPSSRGIFRQGIDTDLSLSGIVIPSNQTLAIHAEQFVDLEGPLRYVETVDPSGTTDCVLENDTELEFLDVMLLRKDDQGSIESKFFASILPKQKVEVRWLKQPPRFPEGSSKGASRLLDTWVNEANLAPGGIRMVGQTEGPVGEMMVVPELAQEKTTTLIVANLKNPALPLPLKDQNLASDISQKALDESVQGYSGEIVPGENP